jgi:hypothetical protein
MDDLDRQMADALDQERYDDFERLAGQAQLHLDQTLARLSEPQALREAACWYAGRDIAVFPLQARGKKPFPGSRGFKDATTDREQVLAWWTAHPDANIGLPTGYLFDVIDIDGEQGAISYRKMLAQDALPPVYGRATTGRDCGRHLYIRATGDGNGARIAPGVDYRGTGGYVVAPPSITTRRYDWYQPLDVAGLKAAAA